MFTVDYWKKLGENALGSFSAGTISVLGGSAFDVWTADWRAAVGVGLGAAVLSVLKGLVAKTVGDPQDPSLRK